MDGVRRTAARAGEWLQERTGIGALLPPIQKKRVPRHRHTVWYYMGGMALFLFLVQLVTGVLLLFYYRPSADEAHESVQFLMAEVEFGWLVRSIHHWGANFMILVLFVHLFSTLLLRAYRAPRELTWMTGVVLFALALGLGFTGYLLPWNELAFFATRVGTEIPGAIPVVGEFLRNALRGGEDVTGATLTRFFALHISILPGLAILVMAVHVLLVQRNGMSIPPGVERAGGPAGSFPFFPNFLLRDVIGWLIVLAALASLAALMPAELGEKADPFAPAAEGIRPEWYFMFMFQTLKMLPAHILGLEGELVGILAFTLGGVALLLVPFLDRTRPGTRAARLPTLLALGALVYILVFTVLGYSLGEPAAHDAPPAEATAPGEAETGGAGGH